MAIKNINNIQKNIVNDIDTNVVNLEYLIQSLANLGQREGIKGDGIVYDQFTIKDDIPEYMLNEKKYIKFEFDDNGNIISSSKTTKNNSKISFNDIENTIINNIENYNDIFVYEEKNYLYELCFGKILGSNINDIEVIYNKFNLENNELIHAIRSYYLYSDGYSNYYTLIDIEQKIDDNNKYYDFKLYLFNSSYLGSNSNLFDNFYTSNNDTQIKENLITVFNNKENIITSELYNYFIDYSKNINGSFYTYKLNYNDDNTNISIDLNNDTDNKYNDINNLLSKGTYNFNTIISFINNDIIYMFPKILEYYNTVSITGDTLYKKIIDSLLLYIYTTCKNKEEEIVSIQIPIEYIFKYQCNSNNKNQIYNSDNNYVIFVNSNDYIDDDNYSNNIICKYSGLNKIINYYYEINYNSKYTNYINNIYINELYTLPYINVQNNWNIYGNDTPISSVGKDAGNPNIIFIYNYKNDNEIKANVIGGVYNQDLQLENYVNSSFIINYNNQQYTCESSLPEINQLNFDFLCYAIIILISDSSCLKNYSGNDKFYITTVCTFNDNGQDSQKFVPIKKKDIFKDNNNSVDNDYAITLSEIFNINNLINIGYTTQIEKAINKALDSVIFNKDVKISYNSTNDIASISALSYNEFINHNKYIHYTLETDNDFNQYKFETSYENDTYNKFNNNKNFTIKYNDIINNNSINKYISNDDVTSVKRDIPLYGYMYINYSKVASENIIEDSLEYNQIKKIDVIDYNESNQYISNYNNLHGNEKTITNALLPTTQLVASDETIILKNTDSSGEKYIINSYTEYYKEYIFNDNTPSLDLSNVFVQNSTTLNRINILALDQTSSDEINTYYSYLYNGYIGTSINGKKHQFIIGTSQNNININKSTLMSYKLSYNLDIFTDCCINFDNIYLNGHTYINNANINNAIIDDIVTIKKSLMTTFQVPTYMYSISTESNFNINYNADINYVESHYVLYSDISDITHGDDITYIQQGYKYRKIIDKPNNISSIIDSINSVDKTAYTNEHLDNYMFSVDGIYLNDYYNSNIIRLQFTYNNENRPQVNFLNITNILKNKFNITDKINDENCRVISYVNCGNYQEMKLLYITTLSYKGYHTSYMVEMLHNISSIKDRNTDTIEQKGMSYVYVKDLDIEVKENNHHYIINIYGCNCVPILDASDSLSTSTTSTTSTTPTATSSKKSN